MKLIHFGRIMIYLKGKNEFEYFGNVYCNKRSRIIHRLWCILKWCFGISHVCVCVYGRIRLNVCTHTGDYFSSFGHVIDDAVTAPSKCIQHEFTRQPICVYTQTLTISFFSSSFSLLFWMEERTVGLSLLCVKKSNVNFVIVETSLHAAVELLHSNLNNV